jgi:hypothetical protein
MRIPRGLIALLICLPLASCGSKEEPSPAAGTATKAPEAQSAAPEPSAAAPQEASASIDELKQAYEAAKPKDGKAPADPKALVQATNAYAYAVMTDDAIPPREKYPQSLKLYRESQKLDPSDAESAKWVKEIEDIYKSMGRPIPE